MTARTALLLPLLVGLAACAGDGTLKPLSSAETKTDDTALGRDVLRALEEMCRGSTSDQPEVQPARIAASSLQLEGSRRD